MNVYPSPGVTASIAGTARAAARGGETDNQATEATRRQAIHEQPAGRSAEGHVDAGEQTDDRGGDGRQALDSFVRDQEPEQPPAEAATAEPQGSPVEGSGTHLDLQA